MVYDAGKMRAECGKLNEVRCAEQCVQSRQPGDRKKKKKVWGTVISEVRVS